MDAASMDRDSDRFGPMSLRLRSAVELATVVLLLEAELWYLRAHGPAWVNVLIYAAIVATVAMSHHRRPAVAPTSDPIRAWAEALGACLVLSTILVIAAGLVGDSNETFEFVFLAKPPGKLLNWLVGKFGAALAQQLALQWFLWPCCRDLTGSRSGGLMLASAIFAAIHLPSPTLVAITAMAGLAWIALYRRSGRIAPLVASHMVLATLAHGALPERLTYDMRVGSTATADLDRFAALADPHARLVNRRLKENRAEQRYYSSEAYYTAQGGTEAGFIRALHRDLLGRSASDADVASWMARKLANPRLDLPPFFLGGDEYARIKEERRAGANPRSARR